MENKMIGLSTKFNSTKNWSKSPTSEFLTDIAESIITHEWKSGCQSYQSTRTSRHRWLVAYSPNAKEEIFDIWSDWIEENETNMSEKPSTVKFIKKFGLVPKFARAYEVIYNPKNSCLECSCGHWNRLRIPCRHLAAVINQNEELSCLYPNGFPMSSVSVKWMNDYYYLGMHDGEFNSTKYVKSFQKLVRRDSSGLYCPREIKDDNIYEPDERIVNLFKTPAKYRVLNYSKEKMDEIFIDKQYQNENSVPMGLSQESYNNKKKKKKKKDSDDFLKNVSMYHDPNNISIKSQTLTETYYTMLLEITKCRDFELMKQMQKQMDNVIIKCRENNMATKGSIVSSHPPNCKRRRTHGVSHML